jgi:hypothetical protein
MIPEFTMASRAGSNFSKKPPSRDECDGGLPPTDRFTLENQATLRHASGNRQLAGSAPQIKI